MINIHQHPNFRPFPPCVLLEMPGNLKFDPFLYVKKVPKVEKKTDREYRRNSSEGGQDTSACKISGHSLHAFPGKCPEKSPDGRTDRRTDGHAAKWSRLVGWPTDPWTGENRIFQASDGRTDGRTDGQPENIMPPAPTVEGIKIATSTNSIQFSVILFINIRIIAFNHFCSCTCIHSLLSHQLVTMSLINQQRNTWRPYHVMKLSVQMVDTGNKVRPRCALAWSLSLRRPRGSLKDPVAPNIVWYPMYVGKYWAGFHVYYI